MRFIHYSGAGNTFLLADNRQRGFDAHWVPSLCAEAGVDGILLIGDSPHADASIQIFNRDGSEAEMCGNGLRCCIRFLKELGIEKGLYQIQTQAGIQQGWVQGEEVCVRLAPPTELNLHLPYDLFFVNTGVPHAVLFVESVDQIDVETIGRALRFSPRFAPAGANINFACLNGDGTLTVRTYERGVEGETGACGTGATAVALIAHKVHALASPISIRVRSGAVLTISFNADWSEVTLQGPATRIGVLEFKESTPIMAKP